MGEARETMNRVTEAAFNRDLDAPGAALRPGRRGRDPDQGTIRRVRACDVTTTENGLVTSHRLDLDQMDLLGQLGLAPGE